MSPFLGLLILLTSIVVVGVLTHVLIEATVKGLWIDLIPFTLSLAIAVWAFKEIEPKTWPLMAVTASAVITWAIKKHWNGEPSNG